MIRNDLISKPSLLPSEVPGTDRSCLQGPRPAQDTPHMGVCCPCRQHAESGCASRGCAESGVCTRRPWPRRAETTGAAVGQGASAVEKRRGAGGRGGRGEVSGTKGEGDPREGGGAGRATQDPGCPGRGGPCLLGLRPGGHAVIPALKPRAEMRGLETRVLPGVKAGTLAPQAAPLLRKRVQSQTHELGNVRTRTGRPGSALYKTGN